MSVVAVPAAAGAGNQKDRVAPGRVQRAPGDVSDLHVLDLAAVFEGKTTERINRFSLRPRRQRQGQQHCG